MLAKKKPPPITTHKTFFKALRLCHEKYGMKFELVQTYIDVWDDEGWAFSNCIWHRSKSTSIWNPIEVVYHVFYSPSARLWKSTAHAGVEIGLPQTKLNELVLAYREAKGHYTSLREQMCEAVGLVDVPIHQRSSYTVMENMHKRRR